MKTNTLKTVIICIICAATMMAGCLESDDTTSIDSIFDSADTTSKDIVFDIDLILGHHTEPGVMEVELYDDNTAKINTITGSGDAVETGTWQFYRESADHKLYDITTDDTELRVALQNSGHAIAYIYEDHFTKCGEPFYGVWEQMGEESTDESTPTETATSKPTKQSATKQSVGLPVLPVTATLVVDPMQFGSRGDLYVMEIVFHANGDAEFCLDEPGKEWCKTGTWELYRTQGATSRRYDLIDCAFYDLSVTMRDDGTAIGEIVGEQFKGTWESGTESTFVLEQRESEPDYTVIDWQISASYAEYEESGRYTGNYDMYYNNSDMPYTESSWAARQPTTLADILDDMGIQYDRIVVVSEDVETPNDWQYNVNGEYILTGDEIEIIELSAHWAGRRY